MPGRLAEGHILLYEAHSQNKYVRLTELDALFFSAGLQGFHGNFVSEMGVVRKRRTCRSVKFHEVEKDTSTTDAMLCPILGHRVNKISIGVGNNCLLWMPSLICLGSTLRASAKETAPGGKEVAGLL
jgi:hypothetical protein